MSDDALNWTTLDLEWPLRVERVLVVGFVLVIKTKNITATTIEGGTGEVGNLLEPGRFCLMMSGPGGHTALGAGVIS